MRKGACICPLLVIMLSLCFCLELEKALSIAQGNIDRLSFIEVHLDRFDCSQGLTRLGQALRSPHA